MLPDDPYFSTERVLELAGNLPRRTFWDHRKNPAFGLKAAEKKTPLGTVYKNCAVLREYIALCNARPYKGRGKRPGHKPKPILSGDAEG